MQPPPRSPTHLAMLWRFVIEDEDRNDGRAGFDRSGERRLVSKTKVAAEPEDYRRDHRATFASAVKRSRVSGWVNR